MRRRAHRILRLGGLAATAAIVLVWLLLLRPVAFGGPAAYVIVSGRSMEPTMHSGDLVVALPRPTYRVGDVVVFRVPAGGAGAGTTVVHRIVGGSASSGYVLRGDNKGGVDPWRPTEEDVLGTARLTVPRAGSALLEVRTPMGMALLAGATTLLVAFVPARRRPRSVAH
jgi:signal peptidase